MIKKAKKKEIILIIDLVLLAIAIIAIILIGLKSFTGFTIYQSQLNLTNGQDTYIRENFNAPLSSSSSLKIGKIASGAQLRALLQFNLADIPSTSGVYSANLQVTTSLSSSNTNITINAYRVTTQWDASNATWTNSTSSSLWSSAGGDYDNTLIDSINFTNITGKSYNFTITNVVRNWVNGTYSNYGLILVASTGAAGDWKEIYSSKAADNTLSPLITVNYSLTPPPIINNFTTNTNTTYFANVSSNVIFSLNWTDLQYPTDQIYVCNSSSINVTAGCVGMTYCSSSLSSANPATCSYTVSNLDNRTTVFWISACSAIDCATPQKGSFYMNHAPGVSISTPNGGEVINQSVGNYLIKFNVTDSDKDLLTANISYGLLPNATINIIATNLNLSSNCAYQKFNSTPNQCTYSWNTTGLFGKYYLAINVTDSYAFNSNTSASSFNITSILSGTAPDIDDIWIIPSENITSGSVMKFYANISGQNMNNVWVSVNTTPEQNLTMFNQTANTYNAEFIAPGVGNYQYIIYANDLLENLNASSPKTFNVSKPIAIAQSISSPSTANPYTAIQINSVLNSSNPLRDVTAYLNIPSGFIFLSDYPQNAASKNYSANETNTTIWILSTPLEQGNYSANVTYTDYYGNSWNSSSSNIAVNYSAAQQNPIYSLIVTGYPTVASTQQYLAQAMFTKNGLKSAPDSIYASIYDALGNLVAGPAAMNNPSIGVYNYTYTLGSSVAQGQWQTIINATKDSVSYYGTQFWKATGGPFDIRDISADNTAIDNLRISVITENMGNAIQDLTLDWNLTRMDNGATLDQGADTFAVDPLANKTWVIYPSTTYIGQVKITFLGTYSQTEKAGAYFVFSTTPAGTKTTASGGGGGGGSGGIVYFTPSQNASQTNISSAIKITADNQIYVANNIEKDASLTVTDTGVQPIDNISLSIENLPSDFYEIVPPSKISLAKDESTVFLVKFKFTNIETGTKHFTYVVSANGGEARQDTTVTILPPAEFFLKEIARLQKRVSNVKTETSDQSILKNLDICSSQIPNLQDFVQKEQFIDSINSIKEIDSCIDKVESSISGNKGIFSSLGNLGWLITWLLLAIILVAIIILLYILYKRLNLVSFLEKEEKSSPKNINELKEDLFEEKLRDIEKKLK